MTMGVVVRKSSPVVVTPSDPVNQTTTTVKLSSFDVGLHTIPANVLLMYEHPIHSPAETIKRALSQALVHYYPIAGRMVAGANDGEVHIHCNGEGVAFVAASADCALKEAISLDRSAGARATLLDELSIYYPSMRCGPGDPLLMMQVTEFSCGGFAVGVTGNHGVGDGAGWAQFLQAVGELASGNSSPSIVPIRQDDSLPSRPSTVGSLSQLMTSLEPLDGLACIDITVPSRVISSIKAEYAKRFDGKTCTSFEVVSAVLWQCRTRAIMSDPETLALFLFGVNLREYMGAKIGYYGNCATGQMVMAKSGAVANGEIMDLVTMIKESKEKIPDQFKKSEGATVHKPVDQNRLLDQQLRYNMLTTSSWRNLGFEKVDFGSGRPARVTPYAQEKLPFPACMMSLPHKGKDGANIFTAMVKEEHAETFLKELTRFT